MASLLAELPKFEESLKVQKGEVMFRYGNIFGTMCLAGLLSGTAAIPPAQAHHAGFIGFEPNREITLSGTIREFEYINPHAWIVMDVQDGSKVTMMEHHNRVTPGVVASGIQFPNVNAW